MLLNRVDGSICLWGETPQKPSVCFPAVHFPAGHRVRWTGMPWAARHRAHPLSSSRTDRMSPCPLTTCDLFLFSVHLPAQQTLFSWCFVETSFELWIWMVYVYDLDALRCFVILCYEHVTFFQWCVMFLFLSSLFVILVWHSYISQHETTFATHLTHCDVIICSSDIKHYEVTVLGIDKIGLLGHWLPITR